METVLVIIAALLAVAGVAGNILMVIPGPPLNYAALLIVQFARPDQPFGTGFLVTFGILTVLAVIVDYVLPLLGARLFGVSKHGTIGSIVGMIAGFVVFSVPGMLIGLFAGAFAGELMAGKRSRDAFRAGAVSFMGSIAASVLKLALSLVMTFYFVVGASGHSLWPM